MAESSGNGDRVGEQSPVSGLLQGCGWDQEIAIEDSQESEDGLPLSQASMGTGSQADHVSGY